MSELTPCNFCNLRRYRRQAVQENKYVLILRAEKDKKNTLGGYDVYMIPKGVRPDKREEFKQYKISWMWEISDRCVC